MQSIYVFISGALPSLSRACEGEVKEEEEEEGEEEEGEEEEEEDGREKVENGGKGRVLTTTTPLSVCPSPSHLHQQLGTLNVSNERNGVLYRHSPGDVTLGDHWRYAVLSQWEVDHQVNLLLAEVVSNTLKLDLSTATTRNIRSDFTSITAAAVAKWPFYCLDLYRRRRGKGRKRRRGRRRMKREGEEGWERGEEEEEKQRKRRRAKRGGREGREERERKKGGGRRE